MQVLEDLDALAGNISFRHVVGNPMLVTAAVDRIAIQQLPDMGKNQRLSGQVTWVGTSSMEIRMQISEIIPAGEGETSSEDHWLEAYFTFVAVDPTTHRPIKICPLVPETSEERALFELGAMKAARKKQNRKKGSFKAGEVMSEEFASQDKRVAGLLQEAFPLLRMPSLADPNSILMSHTMMQNTLVAQPQVRNLNDKIFGGFLMRRAFELAFANAYTFGGEWPEMLEVDNITFHRPVDIGNLLHFQSRVIYTLPDGGDLGVGVAPHKGKPLVMIEVLCTVLQPEKIEAHISNRFYFTFLLPSKDSCRKVLPGTLEEARGMVERMVADEEQAGLQKGYLCKMTLDKRNKGT
jgi:acyl-coenzyme A thioesterase 9